MKQVKNIVAVSVVALSMAFAGGLSVATNVNWTDLDVNATGATGQTVLFGFNNNTSLGIDSQYGMLAVFNVVAGANLRLGWGNGHTIGLGYTFWSSAGDGVKTSLSTSVNFTKTPGDPDVDPAIEASDDLSLSMSLGFSL
ncbi:MAG: hypothetical protein QF535_20490 [Anaerolineales bacterium]|nr:hypothetical protein [Anaerolineales bacterium]